MSEPNNMIIPMLREMRSDFTKRFDGMDKRFDKIESRLDSIDVSQKNFKNALTADTMMGKLVVGDFEERIADLEKRVATLLDAS